MSTRTAQRTVGFSSPFWLSGLSEQQPAGEYLVEQCWEPLAGLTQLSYRCTDSFLHLPAIGTRLVRQIVPIDPAELQAVLEKDHTL